MSEKVVAPYGNFSTVCSGFPNLNFTFLKTQIPNKNSIIPLILLCCHNFFPRSSEAILPSLPKTERATSLVLGGDPKGKNFLYAHDNNIFIRDIEVSF